MDPQRFVPYYLNQAGNGLPGFAGAPMVYGRGLGSVLSRAFRFVLPFLKRGVDIAKPHLKSAAKGIASDVVSTVTSRLMKGPDRDQSQEGSGLLQITRGKPRKSIAVLARNTYKRRKRTRDGVSSNRRKKGSQLRRSGAKKAKKRRRDNNEKGHIF